MRSGKQRDVPPSITVQKAIELLQRQIDRSDELVTLFYKNPRIDAWENNTEAILTSAFGLPNGELHRNTREFKHAHRGQSHVDMQDYELQDNHAATQVLRKQLLMSFLEQLQDLAPPGAAAADGQYRFHPSIERCSGQLFRDGHYQQAVLTAYIEVIDAVKKRSQLMLDGDTLMNKAFGCENQMPVIKFNAVQSIADRDEQKGFMYLYKGVVGLRNSKAHSNRLINDPARAHEYLALASLCLRLLEIADVNP